jgi:membrane protein DedA with SNARE-associated domain
MEQINAFLDLYGLAALFVLLLLKSIGVPIPVPNDVIMLSMAVRASEGRLIVWQAFFAGLAALVLGGIVQFLAVRTVGRGPLYRYGHYLGLTPTRLDAVAEKVKQGGPASIGIAIFTPGLRSIVVYACALAGLRLRTFTLGIVFGSGLLLGLHFFLGYMGRFVVMRLGVVLPTAIIVTFVAVGMAARFIVHKSSGQRPAMSGNP